MLEKIVDGIAAGGPMFCLFGFMLWLWVKQAEKHESHWIRMMTESLAVQEKRGRSDMELAKVLGKMELLMEKLMDLQLEMPVPANERDPDGSWSRKVQK